MSKASCFLLQIQSRRLELKTCYFLSIANFIPSLGVTVAFCTQYKSGCKIVGSCHLNKETMQNHIVTMRNTPKCVLFLHLLAQSFLHGPNSVELLPRASKLTL